MLRERGVIKQRTGFETCKVVQVNSREVFVIGGSGYQKVEVFQSCVKVNIATGEFSEMAGLLSQRAYGHSVCCITNTIYLVGGGD